MSRLKAKHGNYIELGPVLTAGLLPFGILLQHKTRQQGNRGVQCCMSILLFIGQGQFHIAAIIDSPCVFITNLCLLVEQVINGEHFGFIGRNVNYYAVEISLFDRDPLAQLVVGDPSVPSPRLPTSVSDGSEKTKLPLYERRIEFTINFQVIVP